MEQQHYFHRFAELPQELRQAIWEVPLTEGSVIKIERVEGHFAPRHSLLTPTTWDASTISEACQEANRVVKGCCQPIELVTLMQHAIARYRVLWLDFSRTTFHFSQQPRSYARSVGRMNEEQPDPFQTRLQYASFAFKSWGNCIDFCYYIAPQYSALKAVFIYASEPMAYGGLPPCELLNSTDDDQPLPDDIIATFRGEIFGTPTRTYMSEELGSLFWVKNPNAYHIPPRIVILP